ncbi:L7Ae/L30e/S12e/Gadd45 family ribosomal protein [Christensenella tenuis]|jgi:ribosomal protein L7Ae-like RNA K-turn-binding protein|uniref:Ribosomal L7Ae/L30e/S12e/Gadd45 family protein n=1 Tax=Christensenella tenuis TaxID=2763033 RepID=A0ABR7EDR3_9FIRM|nr:ribosomal L7Ae/L30e/S12e/Gadd45 family protein [Christensenella tenuis]MBC5647224.1 ribosomal L7Ae/L30e/S12e/Gadd45 family protein [Christensenella tenuis]
MENEKFLRFLGLAARAGKIICGAQGVDQAVKKRKAKLVVADGGASENTKKQIKDACAYYHVKCIILDECGVLGKSIHKPNNKVIGIVCPQFAQSAWDKYNAISGGETIEQD